MAGEPPGACVTTQITKMTDASLPQEFGGQEREQCLQRRDLLRAGPSRGGDGPGQVEVQEHGKEQKRPATLVENRRPSSNYNRARTSSAMSGTTEPSRVNSPGCGGVVDLRVSVKPARWRTRKRYDSLDVKALGLSVARMSGQGAALTAEGTGTFRDCLAFRGGLATEWLGGKEGVEVGVRAQSWTTARTVPTWNWNRWASWLAVAPSRKEARQSS